MTRGRQVFAEFMLEHISRILKKKYPIFIGEYTFGQKIRAVEDWGDCKIVTVGTICGVEFFDDGTGHDCGTFYLIEVDFSQAVFTDGRVMNFGCDKCERILSTYIKPIANQSVVSPFEVTV